MRSLLGLTGALALALSTIAATAMPTDGSLGANPGLASQAAYGCGAGMTRAPSGYCRPRFACPPGSHPGYRGLHCYRNRW